MWTLHEGEAFRWLCSLPDASVDALITDPPYSSGGQFRGDRAADTDTKYTSTEHQGRFPSFDGDTRDQRSWSAWCTLWLAEAWRVTRPGGVCAVWTDWRQLPALTDAVQAAGWVWRGIMVWDKTESVRPARARPRAQAEYAVWGSRGALSVNREADVLPGVIRHRQNLADKHHQTGKPTPVMQHLVQVCERGGVVLDPFAGSGTTGVAALLEGRRFLGAELSPHYAGVARERLATVKQAGAA